MNANCYKIIFSKRLGTLIAVGEHATSTGKAASGQACHSGAAPDALFSAMAEGFVGVLRLTFASVALACLSLGVTQAQSGSNSLASTALPQGSSVNTGSASISTNGAQMAINQTTDKASINWQSFNVGTGASVNITQPSASSVLLNRVVGNDPSQILGKLSANGQLILLNPNGIVFGKDGSVTASTFTASTFGLSDADFMDGFYKYKRNGSTAAVVNQGTIETSAGGFVALIGATVTNEGTIHAPQGDVMLVAAETVTLPASSGNNSTNSNNTVSVRMSKRVRLELDPAAINTAVHNTESGVIVTEGGQVLLQSAALSTAVASVTHDGSIDTSAPQAGAVAVLADNGVIKVDGSITANSSRNTDGNANRGGNIIIGRDEETNAVAKVTDVSGAKLESQSGFIETSGEYLATNAVSVKAKDWLLDPSNITISTGTDTGYTNISGTYTPDSTAATSVVKVGTIQDAINAGTSITITTTNTGTSGSGAGNITIANALSFNNTGTQDATLSLIADNGIIQNATISATGSKLVNISMDAKGNYQGIAAPSANSDGININSGITTNGNILLKGATSKDNNEGVYIGGVTLTAKNIEISGTSTGAYAVSTAENTKGIRSFGTLNATNEIKLMGNSTNVTGVGIEGGSVTATNGSVVIEGVTTNGYYQGANIGFAVTGASVRITGNSKNHFGVGIGAAVTATSGDVYIEGTTSAGTRAGISMGAKVEGKNVSMLGNSAGGVGVDVIALVKATDTGVTASGVTLTGSGGNTYGNYDHGVWIRSTGSVNSASKVAITGNNNFSPNTANAAFGAHIQGAVAAAGDITLEGNTNSTSTVNNGLVIQAKVASAEGSITIKANAADMNHTSLVISGGGELVTANQNIELTANSMNFGSATAAKAINAGTGTVGIRTKDDGKLIKLGLEDTSGMEPQLRLNQTEFNKITAGNVVIGHGQAGHISVDGPITTEAATGNITLQTNGNITLSKALTIGDDPLTVSTTENTKNLTLNGLGATSTVSQSEAIKASGLDLLGANVDFSLTATGNQVATLAGNAKSINYLNASALTIGTVNNTNGITTTGNVSVKTTSGDLTLSQNINTPGSVNLEAAAAITYTTGITSASTLNLKAGSTIGSSSKRVQTDVTNLSMDSGGDQFLTEANAINVSARTTANNGSIDIATTNGTLNVGTVNTIAGITSLGNTTLTSYATANALEIGAAVNSGGNVTLTGHSTSLTGINIASAITASNGTITLVGTTDTNTRPSNTAYAGISNSNTVQGKDINLTATATDTTADVLGYYGASSSLIASHSLTASASSAGSGVGFYMWGGYAQSGAGMSMIGTSNTGHGIALENNASLSNSTSGSLFLTGETNNMTTRSAISLSGSTISNTNEGITLMSNKGDITANQRLGSNSRVGNIANTISANGAISITAGQTASSTDAINASLLTIEQNSNAGVAVSTSGTGNVTVPKIINAGTGDIVVAAGTSVAAGTGTGGQILTVVNNTLAQTNAARGKTYVYSGSADATGVLSNLSPDFDSLYYQGTRQALNAGFSKQFDAIHSDDMSLPSGGSAGNTQVFFRSATKPGFSMTLANTSKIYGDADPTLSATNGSTLTNVYAGANGNNTFAVATADVVAGLAGARATGEDVGTYAYSLNASSFNTTLTAQPNLVIGQRDITLSALMADHKTYDGTKDAHISSATFNTVNSETLGLEGAAVFDSKNTGNGKTVSVADIATLTKSDGTGKWSNYHLTTVGAQTTHADISQAPLTVTATQVSKEYDGLTTASGVGTVGTLAGAGAGDVVNSAGVQVFATKDAGTNNKTVQASDVTIKDTTGNDVTFNYSIQYVNNTTSTISPAPLTIKVNDTAMFVTQDARTALDQGFSYSAFKNGETAATALNGGALTAADRTYTGTSHFPVAGSYNRVYDLATTPTSVNGNYAITVQKGNLTVTPADKLLITIASQSDAYGNRTASNAGHSNSSLVTAQYCLSPTNCNGANLVDLNMTQLTANQWKATDNTGSYVVFDTTVTGTAYSTGGFLKIGNYTFSSTEIAPLSLPNGNFTGRATNGGVLTIHPLAVTLGVNSISKTYDGNTNITGASIAASNAATGDIVNATASTGSYASKDAANGIAVTLSNLSLTGADAANYYLATNSVSGTGIITPKNLTASFIATNKVYDGNTQANVTGNSNDIVFNDNVTFAATSANFDNANIGTAKLVSIAGISLGGNDRANYKLLNTTTTATADITAANNSNSSSSSGSSSSGTVTPSKPIIPTDNTNSTESGNGSGGDPSAQNPYLVIPTTKPYVADNCTPTNLEACTCEEQDSDVLPYIAICYQPKKTASTQASKPRS